MRICQYPECNDVSFEDYTELPFCRYHQSVFNEWKGQYAETIAKSGQLPTEQKIRQTIQSDLAEVLPGNIIVPSFTKRAN